MKPGVECNRCEKIVHLNNQCTNLTNKQLNALRASESLEWTCQECQNNSKRRSLIIPNDSEGEDDGSDPPTVQIDIKKLLGDISKEVEKAISKEMKDLNQTLQYQSDKMDDLVNSLEAMQSNISILQKKNVELVNRNNNLETRVGALEQRIQDMEQQKLCNYVEIHNLPQGEDENVNDIVTKVAKKLNQKTDEFRQVKRLAGRNERPGPVLVQLISEQAQASWITASKNMDAKITASDVVPQCHTSKANNILFVCEALTPYNKQLLYQAKQDLKELYRYIWIKKGVLRVRKEGENQKPYVIRSFDDIKRLYSSAP